MQSGWYEIAKDQQHLRDRDKDTDGTLDERLYVAQDANYNLTALFDNAGNVVERYAYDPYGQATILAPDWSVLHDGDYARSSLERWAYSHRSQNIQVHATTLDSALARWEHLDLVKTDAEGAEILVWEGMQETLNRFPHAAVLVEPHLQRDPPQVTSFLHQLEQSCYRLCYLNYGGDIAGTDSATIVANPQEHWMLWLCNRRSWQTVLRLPF